MADRVFVDAADEDAGVKRDAARSRLLVLVREGHAVLSTQVLQEYFVAVTRKLGIPADLARGHMEVLAGLDVVIVRPEHVLGAIDLHRLHSISFWDALVIRCASASGCASVLTEDLNHGQVIDGVRIENPFHAPRPRRPK